jgi:hypothetical protein
MVDLLGDVLASDSGGDAPDGRFLGLRPSRFSLCLESGVTCRRRIERPLYRGLASTLGFSGTKLVVRFCD